MIDLNVQKLEKQVQQQAQDGCKFIEVLIKYFSSPAEKLEKKHLSKTEKRPKKKFEQYISSEG